MRELDVRILTTVATLLVGLLVIIGQIFFDALTEAPLLCGGTSAALIFLTLSLSVLSFLGESRRRAKWENLDDDDPPPDISVAAVFGAIAALGVAGIAGLALLGLGFTMISPMFDNGDCPEGSRYVAFAVMNEPPKEEWCEDPAGRKQGRHVTWRRDVMISEVFYVDGIKHGLEQTFHHDGSPESTAGWEMGVQQGAEMSWFPNGQMRRKSNYVDGKVDGDSIEWNADGTMRSMKGWRMGVPHGSMQTFFPGGKPQFEGEWVDGKKVGTHRKWAKNGTKTMETHYVDGKAEGPWLLWHSNGRPEVIGQKAGDLRVGEWQSLDDKGTLTEIGTYDDKGKKTGLWVTFHPNGTKASEASYLEGEAHGPYATWYESGKPSQKGEYAKGASVGTWTTWYLTAGKKDEIGYLEDAYHGPYKSWDILGNQTEDFEYDKGVRVGTWKTWSSGKLRRTTVYDQGNVVSDKRH